ncbi:uncharacterized protein [Rutidosis leptorrhynchoides]|uniref:uncharacterized protein n=1 Tax=Rutidosis leptorrhynchoides TaxID=125765 RepID=UPI003A9A25F2
MTVTAARSSILANESPSLEFEVHRELRQGDPLGPLQFLLIMERLHLILKDNVNKDISVRNFSGLKVNVSKSNLYGVGVQVGEVDIFTRCTSCQRGEFPFDYFGLLMGNTVNRVASSKVLIDRF